MEIRPLFGWREHNCYLYFQYPFSKRNEFGNLFAPVPTWRYGNNIVNWGGLKYHYSPNFQTVFSHFSFVIYIIIYDKWNNIQCRIFFNLPIINFTAPFNISLHRCYNHVFSIFWADDLWNHTGQWLGAPKVIFPPPVPF